MVKTLMEQMQAMETCLQVLNNRIETLNMLTSIPKEEIDKEFEGYRVASIVIQSILHCMRIEDNPEKAAHEARALAATIEDMLVDPRSGETEET